MPDTLVLNSRPSADLHLSLLEPVSEIAAVRVLLVEDDDIDAKLIILHAEEIKGRRLLIERAVSIAEARRLLAEKIFDLCIFDFWLGCETSLRLLAELQNDHPGLPAIVLTSLSTPDIRQMCRQAGAASLVGKETLGSAALGSAITEALRSRDSRADASAEQRISRLLADLVASLGTPHGRTLLAGAAPEEFRQRALIRDHLCALVEMTETVRFALFEQVVDAHRRTAPASEATWISDVGGFVDSAIEIARGLLDGRGQTVSLVQPEAAFGIACDPATLFFLVFELVSRASQQSDSDSRIRASVGLEAGALCLRFTSLLPSDANAAAVALGPLFAQVLAERRGTVTNVRGADGSLVLLARFPSAPARCATAA